MNSAWNRSKAQENGIFIHHLLKYLYFNHFGWTFRIETLHMCTEIDLIEQALPQFRMCVDNFRFSVSFSRLYSLQWALKLHLVKCILCELTKWVKKRRSEHDVVLRKDALTRKFDSFDSFFPLSRSLSHSLSSFYWCFEDSMHPLVSTTWLLINKAASNRIYRQYFIYGIIVKNRELFWTR